MIFICSSVAVESTGVKCSRVQALVAPNIAVIKRYVFKAEI